MIARLWTGRTKAEDYDTYLGYLEESGVAELATPGNKGVMVLAASTATRPSSASCPSGSHSTT